MKDARSLTLALGRRWYGRYGHAFCPAHANHRTPAVSLANGTDGTLLAHCFAGCSFYDITAALRGRGSITAFRVRIMSPPMGPKRRDWNDVACEVAA